MEPYQELIEKSDHAADNFFECFRLEPLDLEKSQAIISILPVDVEDYIVLSDTGMELEEDDIYTPGFVLLQVGIKSKKQCCRLLNQYMHVTFDGGFCLYRSISSVV